MLVRTYRQFGAFLNIPEETTSVEYASMLAVLIVGAIAAELTCGDSLREAWLAIDFDSRKALTK